MSPSHQGLDEFRGNLGPGDCVEGTWIIVTEASGFQSMAVVYQAGLWSQNYHGYWTHRHSRHAGGRPDNAAVGGEGFTVPRITGRVVTHSLTGLDGPPKRDRGTKGRWAVVRYIWGNLPARLSLNQIS